MGGQNGGLELLKAPPIRNTLPVYWKMSIIYLFHAKLDMQELLGWRGRKCFWNDHKNIQI